MVRGILLAIAVFASALMPATATLGGEADVQAAQKTIIDQLRAFQADDGSAAYSHAAPNIKRMFPTVDRFMDMVTGGYMPVRKPRDFSMGKSRELDGTISQQVILTGPVGKTWEALYMLEKQPDGIWRITAVHLRERKVLGA